MQEPKQSSPKSEPQCSDEIEVTCLECLDVLFKVKASHAAYRSIECPFKVNGKCVIKEKGCNCG